MCINWKSETWKKNSTQSTNISSFFIH
jgi:hypothetical protein